VPNVIAVDRLRPGDHACLSFASDAERWEVLRVFAQNGFARGEKVAFFVDGAMSSAEVSDRIIGAGPNRPDGQFVVYSTETWYAAGGRFEAERTIDRTLSKIDEARREGYSGLRGTGDMAWALRPGMLRPGIVPAQSHLSELVGYERAAHRELFGDQRFTGICQYDRRRFSGQLITTMHGIHPVSVLDRIGALRVTATGRGLRVTGDCDLTNRDELMAALRQARSRIDGALQLDLTGLSFMDARCAAEILRLGASMRDGERLDISCGPALRRILTLLGASSAARIRFAAEGQ
jgi:anti-anti-sigma regulatory factor